MRIWTLWGNSLIADTGEVLTRVHDPAKCEGKHPCVIHGPTDHHMRDWPLYYLAEDKTFVRYCPHGESHPDPDQIVYWRERDVEYLSLHACDGCCEPRCAESDPE